MSMRRRLLRGCKYGGSERGETGGMLSIEGCVPLWFADVVSQLSHGINLSCSWVRVGDWVVRKLDMVLFDSVCVMVAWQ